MHADGAGTARRTRRDIDDPAPFARPHRRQNGLRAQECRFQVDRYGAVEIIFCEVIDAAHDRHARIVDEDIDRTERGGNLLDHFGNGHGLRDIGCDEAQGYFFSMPVSPEEIGQLF